MRPDYPDALRAGRDPRPLSLNRGVTFTDPFGLCYDKEKKQARECKVTWSDADRPNRNVTGPTRAMAQLIADRANVDLTLSSGRREGSCSESLHNCGTAVDIKAINDVDIGQKIGDVGVANPGAARFVAHVQGVMQGIPSVSENFGPAGLWKASVPGDPQTRILDAGLQNDHNDHIHAGGFRYLQTPAMNLFDIRFP